MTMNKFFSAENISGFDVTFNACVEGLVDLTKHRLQKNHKANSVANALNAGIIGERNDFFATYESDVEYGKKNDVITKNMLMYAMKDIDYVDFDNVDTLKNPMIKKNPNFQSRFYAIVSMALPSIISGIAAYNYAGFGEVRDTAFGDTAKFEVPSSQLFVVSRSNTGERHGAIQRIYNTEFTVGTENYDITIGIDWLKMVTGRVDLGDWMMRIAQSFAQDIGYRAFKALDDSYAGLPAALKLGGFSDANFNTMADTISAANGGAGVYVTGTKTAIGTVLPTDTYMNMGISQEFVTNGYLGKYMGTNLIETPAYIKKGTVHSAGTFSLLGDDNRLYFMPLGSDRPVKIVFEGNALQIETGHDDNADRQLVISVKHKYGVAVATSAWYGIMEIS